MRHTEKLYAAKLAASMTPSNAGTPGANQAQAQSSALGRGGSRGRTSGGPASAYIPDITSTQSGPGMFAGQHLPSGVTPPRRPIPDQGYGINAQIERMRQQDGPPGPARGPSNPNPYAEAPGVAGDMHSGATPEQSAQINRNLGFGDMNGSAYADMARNAGGMFSGMGSAAGGGGAYSNHAPGPEIFSNTPSAGADPRSFMANAGGALSAINPYMKNMGKALSGLGRAGVGALRGMMNGPTEAQRAGVSHPYPRADFQTGGYAAQPGGPEADRAKADAEVQQQPNGREAFMRRFRPSMFQGY